MGDEMENVNELAKALVGAQSEMKGAVKDSTNPHYKSKYADLASAWEACRAPLTRHGLCVVQMPSYDPDTKCASVSTLLLHHSGQSLESTLSAPVVREDAQGVGSALTYLRRYGLMAVVGIAPEDDDGNDAGQNHEPVQQQAARQATSNGEPILPGSGTQWDGYGGKPLREVPSRILTGAAKWLHRKDPKKNQSLIDAIEMEISSSEHRAADEVEAMAAGAA